MTEDILKDDSMPFASLSIGQTRQFVQGIVSEELSKLTAPKQPEETPEVLNIDEALSFLKKCGLPLKKSSIYKLTHEKAIPHKRIGKRLVFSRAALIAWIDEKADAGDSYSDAALCIAASANRKR